ncbi:phage tail assembly protein [Bradyrhizobium sp. CCGUVB4N]|uniref:phage tail assembly protein n=1 Tax=Bradyrhizobium sp. CCGUVB4N TaxID=2949631 RepID=UPI0020B20244|nr:phage tail assembly protein [Bradyrhizobium sp. CCGUVB4N]MCP3386203.1 phage tail assembly protein [Bradyrhizobium sp. CCGUVB4N]
MSAPAEITLNVPIEIDGARHDKIAVASFDAIANFRTNSPEQVIRSMSQVFGVPRRVIRHLDPADAQRAGDLVVALLNETSPSFR